MIELASLRREYDRHRPIEYIGACVDHRQRGYLIGWNGALAYVEFRTDRWPDYPRSPSVVVVGLYPEHLQFDSSIRQS
jgi:hypothetical protein